MKKITEPAKTIKIEKTYDTVIVGGGIAGVTAAIAAARKNNKVCIIEKENALGGLTTLGLVVVILPLTDGKGNPAVSDLSREIINLAIKYEDDKSKYTDAHTVKFNPVYFMAALEEILSDLGVDIYYDTRFCDIYCENNSIKGLFIENKSGRLALVGKNIIDATGDADVCYKAGEKTVSLDTNRKNSIFFTLNKSESDCELKSYAPRFKYRKKELEDMINIYEKVPSAKTYAGDNWQDVTEMNLQARKLMMEKINALKDKDKYEEIIPVSVSTLPLFRMTRRLSGRKVLTEKDANKNFEDTVGMTGVWKPVNIMFNVPFGILVGTKIDNLITAGRCISTEKRAWNLMRLIAPCIVTGEAAGTAAAIAGNKNIKVNDLDVNLLQEELLKQGVELNK